MALSIAAFPEQGVIIQEDIEVQDRLLVALSSSIRRRMLSILSEADGSMSVHELVERFELSQPTISHHLKTLLVAGVVYRRKHGLYTYYCVNRGRLGEAQRIIAETGGTL